MSRSEVERRYASVERSYDVLVPMSVPKAATPDFDDLFHGYYARLARLLYRITGDTSRAEEVAAEAFWRLHQKPPPAQTNLEGWLYRTGVRLALDQLKMERRRKRYEALASIFGIAKSPEQRLQESEQQMRVRQIFAALKPQTTALILLRADGLSHAELAARFISIPRRSARRWRGRHKHFERST